MFKLLLLLISMNTLAQEDKLSLKDKSRQDLDFMNPTISLKYQRGSYLLYNCTEKHWVCTKKNAFDLCVKNRKIAIKREEIKYPCIPYKKFKNIEKCVDKQTELTGNNHEFRKCLGKNKHRESHDF